jgi:hypothetical protein
VYTKLPEYLSSVLNVETTDRQERGEACFISLTEESRLESERSFQENLSVLLKTRVNVSVDYALLTEPTAFRSAQFPFSTAPPDT